MKYHKPNVKDVRIIKIGKQKQYHVRHWATVQVQVEEMRTIGKNGKPLKKPVVTRSKKPFCMLVTTVVLRRKSARRLGAAV